MYVIIWLSVAPWRRQTGMPLGLSAIALVASLPDGRGQLIRRVKALDGIDLSTTIIGEFVFASGSSQILRRERESIGGTHLDLGR